MKRTMLLALLVTACATPRGVPQSPWQTRTVAGVTVRYQTPDEAVADQVTDAVSAGHRQIEAYFGAPFPDRYEVVIYPDRQQLTDHWREEWKTPELQAQCWMVASGSATALALLSPRVWATEACEHDASNVPRTRALMTHELVHVFHAQHLTGRTFDGMDEAGWFVEGLAVQVSGQLALGHLASASAAIAAGKAPSSLAEAWSGKYKYGVCGSLVGWVEAKAGRPALRKMLAFRTTPELLTAIGLGEPELLEHWRASIP